MEYSNEIGRDLGYDLAKYGWAPKVDSPSDVREGYLAGKAQLAGKTERPNRFERKWLQLRQNALRRGRVVDNGITPKYIETIDLDICPVTLCEMTHGTQSDTDWSVDRVNNNGAYADGNLVVMSVQANKAKGGKSYDEVATRAEGLSEGAGLTKEEWARLRCIMVEACLFEDERLRIPLLTRIPNRCTRPSYFELQHIVLLIAQKEGEYALAHIRRLNAFNLIRTRGSISSKRCVD